MAFLCNKSQWSCIKKSNHTPLCGTAYLFLSEFLCFLSAVWGTKIVVSPNILSTKQITGANRCGFKPNVALMAATQFFKLPFNKSLIPYHLIYDLCVWLRVCVIHLLQCDNLIFNAGGDTAGRTDMRGGREAGSTDWRDAKEILK